MYYRIDPRIVKRKGRKEIERSSLNEYVWDTKRGELKAKNSKKSQRMKANNHNREMPRCKPSMGSRSPMNEKTVAYKSRTENVHKSCGDTNRKSIKIIVDLVILLYL